MKLVDYLESLPVEEAEKYLAELDAQQQAVPAPVPARRDELFSYIDSLPIDEAEQFIADLEAGRASGPPKELSPYDVWGQQVAGQFQQAEPDLDEDGRGFWTATKDVGIQTLGAVPKAAGAIASLGSMVPGLHYVADPLAEGLYSAGDWIEEKGLSDYQKQMNAELSQKLMEAIDVLGPDAGVQDYIDAIVRSGGAAAEFLQENPTQIIGLVAQTIPHILGGALAVKGLQATRLGAQALKGTSPILRGGIGEGIMITGETARGIVEGTEDEGYTASRLLAPVAGIAGTGVSYLGGRGMQRLGMGGADIDTLIAKRLSGGIAQGTPTDLLGREFVAAPSALTKPFGEGAVSRGAGRAARALVGGAVEGIVEEAPQSLIEGAVTNIATGRPIEEGLGGQAVLGAAAGSALGGVMAGATRPQSLQIQDLEADLRRMAPGEYIKPDSLIRPRNIKQSVWENVEPSLQQAATREDAEAILRSDDYAGMGFVSDGELTTAGKRVLDQWKTVLDLERPYRMPKSLWDSVEPSIRDARTQEAVELTLRTDPEGRFVNTKGDLNKDGRKIVAEWQRKIPEANAIRSGAAFIDDVADTEDLGAPAVEPGVPERDDEDAGAPQAPGVVVATPPAPARQPAPAAPRVTTETGGVPVPPSVQSSKSRWKSHEVNWESPVDLAAYNISKRDPKPKSKSYQEQLKYIQDVTGYTEAEAKAYGQQVRARLKAAEAQARDAQEVLNLPQGEFAVATQAAAVPESASPIAPAAQDDFDAEFEKAWTEAEAGTQEALKEDRTALQAQSKERRSELQKEIEAAEAEDTTPVLDLPQPRHRRALALALQGFLPGFVQGNEAQRRLASLTDVLAELGPDGAALQNALIELHQTLLARDAAVRKQGVGPTRAAVEKVEPDVAVEGARTPRETATASVQRLDQEVAQQLAQIEALVGRPTMLRALESSKAYMSTLSKDTPFFKGVTFTDRQTAGLPPQNQDTSAGIRFSRQYRAFRTGELGAPFMREETYRPEKKAKEMGVADKEKRPRKGKRSAVQVRRRHDTATTRLADIMDADALEPATDYRPGWARRKETRGRAETFLHHLRVTADTGFSRILASRVMATAKAIGLFDHPERIQIRLLDTYSEYGQGVRGSARFNQNYDSKATEGDAAAKIIITIYKPGHNTVTVVHELIHAITMEAILNPKFRNSHQHIIKQFETLIDNLLALTPTQRKNRFGLSGQNALNVIEEYMKEKRTPFAIAELLSYGLTDSQFQRGMLKMSVKKGEAALFRESLGGLGTVWQRFVSAVKAVFGMLNVTNTEFERFLFATDALLIEVEKAAGRMGKPRTRSTLEQIGAVPPDDNAKFDPDAWLRDPDNAKAAEAAATVNTTKEAGVSESTKTSAQDRKRAAEKAKKEEIERIAKTPEERARVAKKRAEKAQTLILASGKSTRDATWIDRAERAAFNAVYNATISPFFKDSKKDFERDMNAVLTGGAKALQSFLKRDYPDYSPQRIVQNIVNILGAGLVDRYGVPDAVISQTFRVMKNLSALDGTLATRMEPLINSLSADQKYALLEYLETADEGKVKSLLKDPEQYEAVKWLGKELNDLFAEARDAGLVPLSALEQGSSYTLLDFIKLYQKPEEGKSVRRSVKALSPVEKVGEGELSAVRIEDPISADRVFGKDGRMVTSAKDPSVRYFSALDAQGDEYFVDTRITTAGFKQLSKTIGSQLSPNKDKAKVNYRVRSVKGPDMLMVGTRSKDELVKAKYLDGIVGALAVTAQNWAAKIETKKFYDSMVQHNARMGKDLAAKKGEDKAEDGRYVLDDLPVGPDGKSLIPEQRQIKLTKKQANYTKMREFSYSDGIKLRSPGFWVKVPEDAAESTWGELQGKWISAPVYAAIIDQYDNTPIVDSKGFRMANTYWKKTVTVYSPIAHANNVGGNFVLAYAHDIPWRNVQLGWRLTMIKNLPPNVLAKIGITPTERDRALIKEINDMGIELITFRHSELDAEGKTQLETALKAAFSLRDDNSKAALHKGMIAMENIMAAVKKTDSVATQMYSEQDNIFRIAAYATHLQNVMANMPPGQKITTDDKERAGQYARSAFVDYNIKAPWINALRQGKLGSIQLPFLAWTYRMVPIIAKIAITKPWKLANIMGAVSAFNAMAYALLGVDDDEREEKELLVPSDMRERMWGIGPPAYLMLPWGAGEDTNLVFKLGNMIPLGNIFEMRESARVPEVLVPGGPAVVAFQTLMNYDFFRNRPIEHEFEAEQGIISNRTEFALRNSTPRILVDAFDAASKVIRDEKGALGQDINNWIKFSKFFGVNVREINWQEQEYFRDVELQKMQRDATAQVNRAMNKYYRQGVDPSSDEVYEAVDSIYKKLDKKQRERLGLD
jgi:hypothetical protein